MPKINDTAKRAMIQERQAQILSAAAKVFARKGFERATIAEIAQEAGLAEGSIYNYFKNKGDLLISLPRQIIRPAFEPLSAEISPSAAHEPIPPEAMLTEAARTFVSTFRQNAHIVRIMISAMPTMKPAMRSEFMQTVLLHVVSILEPYFREQVRRGVFRADLDPALATRSFIGTFLPFVMLQDVMRLDNTPFDYEKVIAHSVQLFLQGALVPAKKGKRK